MHSRFLQDAQIYVNICNKEYETFTDTEGNYLNYILNNLKRNKYYKSTIAFMTIFVKVETTVVRGR